MASITPGHPLQKDDVTQSTTQWWEWALNEIGSIDGLFVKYLKLGSRPPAPGMQPNKPPEPKGPGLIAAYGSRLKSKLLDELNKGRPSTSRPATLEDIPEPSELDIWDFYGQQLDDFNTRFNDWKYNYEIYVVTFPAANVKVFSKTVACISETSMLLIRGTISGAAAYDAQDSFGIMQSALSEHSHVAVEVTEEAVKAAKAAFESHMQRNEVSINAHIAEKERLGNYYAKVKQKPLCDTLDGTPGAVSIYDDYDLKHLLLDSLHSKWNEWKRARELSGSMPTRYADLKVMLRTEESKLILIKSGSAPNPSASHATEGKHEKEDEKAHTAGSFQEIRYCIALKNGRKCATPFLALRPFHTKCHQCHPPATKSAEPTAERGKREKGKTSSKPTTSRRGPKRKSHATSGEAEDEEDDEDEDNEAYSNVSNAVNRLSLVTHTSAAVADAHVTEARDTDVYFDPCSNSIIVKDAELAVAINDRGPATRISGSVPGGLLVKEHGKVGDLGRAPVHRDFAKNLISENATLAAGYRVFHDTDVANEYRVTKAGVKPLIFKVNRAGTYSMPMEEFLSSFPSEQTTAVNTLEAEPVARIFTKSQRERAARYHHDHAHCLHHLHHDRVSRALRSGLIEEAGYTAADVANAQIIYGACPQCAVTKGTRHREIGHYPHQPQRPGERLTGDLFNIMGVLFMLVSCRLIKLRTIQRLTNKSSAQMMLGITSVVDVWKGYGYSPKVISWDNEPAIVHSAPDIFSTIGVRMEFVSPGSHERVAEREGRTVKG